MPRGIHKLTDTGIRAEKAAGRHSDGGGLYLNVTSTGTKSWLFMWVRDGKRREMGLGSYPALGLSKARAKATELREAVEAGRDPIAEKRQKPEKTFGECATDYIDLNKGSTKNKAGWSNSKHIQQWENTLKDYCTAITDKPVSKVTSDDIHALLLPIWTEKPETASRLRGRIERVMAYAIAHKICPGPNPALWRGNLKERLPARPAKRLQQHHAAMPYADVPAFMVELAKRPGMAARALELTILNALRSNEVLGARWDEFDLKAAIWTIPPERMKARVEHVVPLSDRALAIVKAIAEVRTGPLLFPTTKDRNKPVSNMVMLMLLRRMKRDDITAHGFRSSFRDWCGDQTSFPREVAEAALAHKVGNEVEQAYRRGSALAKRSKLMQAWANYCFSPVKKAEGNNLVLLARTREGAA
ncbi:tyrosine-type recombinase/integrase [Devosia sp. CN2-171]|uniref:tyrosine-type recombinase/integrase n=1 Tax=Devosia sp. CN2-171 TaxID=3400909 RepID=UPI003BF7B7E8